MLRMITVILALMVTGVGSAAGWTGELTVTSTFTEGTSDFIVIYTSDAAVYTPGCTFNSWIFAADSEPRRGRAYGTILAALASGKKIKFWYTDTCATWSFHQATGVMLVN